MKSHTPHDNKIALIDKPRVFVPYFSLHHHIIIRLSLSRSSQNQCTHNSRTHSPLTIPASFLIMTAMVWLLASACLFRLVNSLHSVLVISFSRITNTIPRYSFIYIQASSRSQNILNIFICIFSWLLFYNLTIVPVFHISCLVIT